MSPFLEVVQEVLLHCHLHNLANYNFSIFYWNYFLSRISFYSLLDFVFHSLSLFLFGPKIFLVNFLLHVATISFFSDTSHTSAPYITIGLLLTHNILTFPWLYCYKVNLFCTSLWRRLHVALLWYCQCSADSFTADDRYQVDEILGYCGGIVV